MIRKFLIAVILPVVAGCGAAPTPAPDPTTSTSAGEPPAPSHVTSISSSLPPRPTAAPKAPRTLDIDRFAKNQCESLTRDQVAALELTAFRTSTQTDGCQWFADEKTTFDLGFPRTDVLGQVYRDANKDFWTVFEPFDINGFPAVKRQHPTDSAVYNCDVVVATGPSQGIHITATNTGQPVDWCAKAVAAARFVVHNLGG